MMGLLIVYRFMFFFSVHLTVSPTFISLFDMMLMLKPLNAVLSSSPPPPPFFLLGLSFRIYSHNL